MTRVLLLGIVAIALFAIAPRVGAFQTIKVDPDRASSSSPMVARTIFDVENIEGEDVVDRRDELDEDGKLEERRDDAQDWAEED